MRENQNRHKDLKRAYLCGERESEREGERELSVVRKV